MKKAFFRLAALLAVTLPMLTATGCTAEEDDGALQLYYPGISNIGPSMGFISDAPSYHGAQPSDFAIEGVKLEGKPVDTGNCFSINSATGAIALSGTDNLATGTYTVTVSCKSDGRKCSFPDIFSVKMLPIAPESIEVSEAEVSIPLGDILTSGKTVKVTTVGESVSIIGYALVQEEGKEYFKVTTAGEIGVNTNFKGEFLAGVYPLTLTMKTYAGDKEYKDIVTFKITSQPYDFAYPASSGSCEAGLAFVSGTPSVKGSAEGLKFSLKKVTPATDKISVDAATGVISVAENNGFTAGQSYVADLTVTNEYGSVDFDGAFTVNVVAFINPIDQAKFSYPATNVIQGGAFSVEKSAGFVGDEVKFSLDAVPAEMKGQISINEATGAITAAKGNTIPVGKYSVGVKAANNKSEASASANITVQDNPYYFSTISYGNNLGLANDGTYANQFRAVSSSEYQALDLVPTTDAKAGVDLEWSVRAVHQCGGTTIDETTGKLTVSGYKANNGGLVLVTATAGKGTSGETSVTVPVFFSFLQQVGGALPINYSPFVIQVNPRKGVTSAAPVSVGVSDPSLMLLDYRRTFAYYNIGGPESHGAGTISATPGTILYSIWSNYFGALNKAVNTGSKDPVSYYSNVANLTQAACYVDAATKSIVVNPNKWMDADGVYANGAFIGQITYVTDGNQSGVNSGSQIFPVWIWFDEKF